MARQTLITPETFTTFGDLLIHLRKRAQLTQDELGRAVGYSRAHITRLEKNQRSPDFATVAANFIPALDLHDDPLWSARLLQLASHARHSAESITLTHTLQVKAELIEETAAPNAPRTNLRVSLTSFIGREKEITDITNLIASQRLVTLTGPGGTGKTRLMQQAASDLLMTFEDGSWWIDLQPLSDPQLVADSIANILVLREEPDRSIDAILIDYLRTKDCLVIMDNCEHLIEACAAIVAQLLQNCPRLHVAATSRERLGVAGEAIYHVPPLTKPDSTLATTLEQLNQYEAAQLFEARAAAVRSDFRLTEKNAHAVAQICDRLDGLPLAIELAAARVNLLSTEDIAARLDDRFQLLTGGQRTAPLRHQTLRAAIDWNYDLLKPAEQILFQRLAVFAGSWTLPAAEMIGANHGLGTSQIMDLLQRLIDKSLIVAQPQEDRPRFQMLETIRQYARDKLSGSGDIDRVRNRHLDFYLQLAEEAYQKISGAEQLIWLNRLEIEYPNLRAALEWSDISGNALAGLRIAGSLGYYWYIRIQYSEGRTWLTRTLSASTVNDSGSGAARARALLWLGWLERHDVVKARACLAESLQIFQALDDRNGQAEALVRLGGVAAQEAKYAEARSLVEQSLPMLQAMGNTSDLVLAFNVFGEIARARADDQSAEVFYLEALALAKQVGNVWWSTVVTQNLGFVALNQGHYAEALTLLEESIRAGRLTKDPAISGLGLMGIAGILVATGRTEQGVRLLSAAKREQAQLRLQFDFADSVGYERTLSAARTKLAADDFARAWDAGQTLTIDQAINIALELTKPDQTSQLIDPANLRQ